MPREGRRTTASLRRRYLTFAIITIALGLIVHRGGTGLAPRLRDALGDALWAMMIVWWISVAVPRMALRTRAFGALVVCFAVEFSQQLRTPMLDAIRRTVPGQLVFGSGYDPRDFVAYTAGVFAAALLVHLTGSVTNKRNILCERGAGP